MAGFRYQPDIISTLSPWRDQLDDQFDSVVARLMDRDRQLEDYVSTLSADLDSAIISLGTPKSCRIYNNANIGLVSGVDTQVTFNSERYDNDDMHSTSAATGITTFNTAGLYIVTFSGEIAAAADYLGYYAYPRINGSTLISTGGSTPARVGVVGLWVGYTTVYRFAAGETIETRVFQSNTAVAVRNLLAAGNFSPEFSATRLGA